MAAALLRPKFESKLDSDPGAAADEASAAVPAEIPPRVVDRVAAEVLGALKANAGALDSLLRRRLVGVWRRAAEGRAWGDEDGLGGGLEEVRAEVRRTATVVGPMAAVNRDVHGTPYSQMLCDEATAALVGYRRQHRSSEFPFWMGQDNARVGEGHGRGRGWEKNWNMERGNEGARLRNVDVSYLAWALRYERNGIMFMPNPNYCVSNNHPLTYARMGFCATRRLIAPSSEASKSAPRASCPSRPGQLVCHSMCSLILVGAPHALANSDCRCLTASVCAS